MTYLAPKTMMTLKVPSPEKTKTTLKEEREKTWVAHQVIETSPTTSEGEGTLTVGKAQLTLYESNSEGENDLIVSGAITPFTAWVEIIVPHSG